MWAECRLVRKTATITLFGGAYETDPVLAGRQVECVFDPFDLTVVEVRWNGRPYGLAIPQHIGRHSHPKAKPEDPAAPPPATGIDYLGIIAAEHAKPPAGTASATTPSPTATASRARQAQERAAAAAVRPRRSAP